MTQLFTCFLYRHHGARVTLVWLKYAAAIMLVLTIGVGNAWGADETLTLNSGCSWGSEGGYKTSTGTFTTSASTSVSFSWTKVMNQSSKIQMAKSSDGGELHSTSYPTSNNTIKSITLTVATNTVNLYGRVNSEDEWSSITYTSGTAKNVSTSGYKYFKVASASSYTQITSIVVTYTTAAGSTKTLGFVGGGATEYTVLQISALRHPHKQSRVRRPRTSFPSA